MKEQAIARLPEGAQEHLGRIEFSNRLLSAVKNGNWKLDDIKAVNNKQQVIGRGINKDGKRHAFLLTPH